MQARVTAVVKQPAGAEAVDRAAISLLAAISSAIRTVEPKNFGLPK
jgi:hypothetical protein